MVLISYARARQQGSFAYAALIFPATARTFLGDARQIATAEITLTPAPIQNASV